MGVTQKLGLPRPFKVQNWNGRGRLNFWATPMKLCKIAFFIKIFKWYYYLFFEIFDRFWSTKKLASLHLHVHQNLSKISKKGTSIIWRSVRKKQLYKVSWVWLKNCYAHFNFELWMGVAGPNFGLHPQNFGKSFIFYR